MDKSTDEAQPGRRTSDELQDDDVIAEPANLQEVYDAIPVALCVIDRDLRFVSLNRRMLEMTGHPAEHYLGRTVDEVVTDATQLERQLRLALEGERIEGTSVGEALVGGSRGNRTLHVSMAPLYRDGSITGVVCATDEQRIGSEIPCSYGHADRIPHTPVKRPTHEPHKGRILIAEDLPMNQAIIADMLTSAGHAVVSVNDGAAAVNLLRRQDFDLVLLDIEMPLMGGLQAARSIRTLDRVARIPIVAMTANNWPEQVAECRAAGMDAYVSKPIDRTYLLNVIERFLKFSAGASVEPPASDARVDSHILEEVEFRFGRDKTRRFAEIVREQVDLVFTYLPNCSDKQGLKDAVHALVSLAGHIGLKEVSAQSRALMTAVRSQSGNIPELAAKLRAAADQALSALDQRYSEADAAVKEPEAALQ